MKTVLLLGATGMFGRRLSDRLVKVAGIKLVVASRSIARATALAKRIGNCDAVEIASRDDLSAVFAATQPFAVIDCSGPFQGANYSVARTCIAAGCHLIDIADARDYLLGFEAELDSLAKQKNVTALSGASSTPCLSVAAVQKLTSSWKRIDTVDMAIAPDGHNDIGRAVAEGTLSYAGKPVKVFRHGQETTEMGWLQGHSQVFAGLGTRRLSIAETVDADIMPRMFGVTSRVVFSAGLFSQLEHRGLQCLAWLRARGIVKNPAVLTPLLLGASRIVRRFGGTSGGMRVCVQGLNADSRWTRAEWSLLAKNCEGPYVPILPIVAAIKLMLRGELTPGARMAAAQLPLAAIIDEMRDLSIKVRENTSTPKATLFAQALSADDLAQLPPVVQQFHRAEAHPVWTGEAKISRGSSILSRIIGRFMGLPAASDHAAVRVSVEREADGRESWTRMFDGQAFHSEMNAGPDNTFWERFGALNFRLKLYVENGRLNYPITKARFCGVPVPRILLPSTQAFETQDEQGRFVFDVKIVLPLGGMLVHYRGWLQSMAR